MKTIDANGAAHVAAGRAGGGQYTSHDRAEAPATPLTPDAPASIARMRATLHLSTVEQTLRHEAALDLIRDIGEAAGAEAAILVVDAENNQVALGRLEGSDGEPVRLPPHLAAADLEAAAQRLTANSPVLRGFCTEWPDSMVRFDFRGQRPTARAEEQADPDFALADIRALEQARSDLDHEVARRAQLAIAGILASNGVSGSRLNLALDQKRGRFYAATVEDAEGNIVWDAEADTTSDIGSALDPFALRLTPDALTEGELDDDFEPTYYLELERQDRP